MRNFETGTPNIGMLLVKMDPVDSQFRAEIPPSKTGEIIQVGEKYDDFAFKGKKGDRVLISKVSDVHQDGEDEYAVVNQTDVLLLWS